MALLFNMPADAVQKLKEQTTLLVNEINARRSAGGSGDPEQALDSACRETMGLPLKTVRSSSPEVLLELIDPNGQAPLRLLMSADLLCLEAEMQKERGDFPNILRSQLQAFYLLAHSLELVPKAEQALYRPKADALFHALNAIDNPYLREKLGAYQPGANS